MGAWDFIKKYILNFDTIILIIICALVIYFVITVKKKKYKFHGVKRDSKGEWLIDSDTTSFPFRKKKRKKRVNVHEEECRRIFTRIFNVKFKSVRPGWLKNPATGKNLELDGFNSSIPTPLGSGLAFEYDGEQHSKYNSYFHNGNVDEFRYQVAKDDYKTAICKKNRIVLVRIPHYVAFNDLERYIRGELRKHNIDARSYGFFSESRYGNYQTVSSVGHYNAFDRSNMYN
jgi:Marseillevirus putative nuclease